MTQSVVQAELASPVRRVWEVLTDLNHQDWRSDIERVEVTGETTFVEYTKGGVATFFTVTRHEPPCYWAFDMENKNMAGHWAGKLESTACGCMVTFTEEVEVRKLWMRPFVKLGQYRTMRFA